MRPVVRARIQLLPLVLGVRVETVVLGRYFFLAIANASSTQEEKFLYPSSQVQL